MAPPMFPPNLMDHIRWIEQALVQLLNGQQAMMIVLGQLAQGGKDDAKIQALAADVAAQTDKLKHALAAASAPVPTTK